MLALHHYRKTWTELVDQYYALTEFSRGKFIEGGLPATKISVKPNFIDPPPQPGGGGAGYVVFVGRLSPEKGIGVLLEAWKQLDLPLNLRIVGDGPLRETVRTAAQQDARIDWLGQRTPDEVLTILGEALCLVAPSLWYEGFPRTILESLAMGTPVIASRLGSMEEIIQHNSTGLHFTPGDASDLISTVVQLRQNASNLAEMRHAAHRTFLSNYSAPANYRLLMEIYRRAMGKAVATSEGNDVSSPNSLRPAVDQFAPS
jgi:glycosyltransferase involved in cell wall biosynthesis